MRISAEGPSLILPKNSKWILLYPLSWQCLKPWNGPCFGKGTDVCFQINKLYQKDLMGQPLKNTRLLSSSYAKFEFILYINQKQPSMVILKKSCSENMQQMYRRTPMPKCDFNEVAFQFCWNHTSAWVFSCKLAAYFYNSFL